MIISIINQKGGTGKTTTTLNLGVGLANLGYKILLIDWDSQGNLTYSLGLQDTSKYAISDWFFNSVAMEDILVRTEGVDVLPSKVGLADLELSMANQQPNHNFLAAALKQIQGYDFILIDCPPALSLLSVNALAASEAVIIPSQMDVLSVQGLNLVLQTIERIKNNFNSRLYVLGILPVMVDWRKSLHKEIKSFIEDNYEINVFRTSISNNIKASEAPSFGKSLIGYSPQSKSAMEYGLLAEELSQYVYSNSHLN